MASLKGSENRVKDLANENMHHASTSLGRGNSDPFRRMEGTFVSDPTRDTVAGLCLLLRREE